MEIVNKSAIYEFVTIFNEFSNTKAMSTGKKNRSFKKFSHSNRTPYWCPILELCRYGSSLRALI